MDWTSRAAADRLDLQGPFQILTPLVKIFSVADGTGNERAAPRAFNNLVNLRYRSLSFSSHCPGKWSPFLLSLRRSPCPAPGRVVSPFSQLTSSYKDAGCTGTTMAWVYDAPPAVQRASHYPEIIGVSSAFCIVMLVAVITRTILRRKILGLDDGIIVVTAVS